MTEKANNAASMDGTVVLPDINHFIDGRPFDPNEGGVVVIEDEHHALALPGTVVQPDTEPPIGEVPKNRWALVPVHQRVTSLATDYGDEFEAFWVDEMGEAKDLPPGEMPELYTFMDEKSTPPTDDPAELLTHLGNMMNDFRSHAAQHDALVLPTAVFGQREPHPTEQNPHRYIGHVSIFMHEATGFHTSEVFRVAGAQEHTRISDTMSALHAGEAMQYLNPILMAPGLSGPFLEGGTAGNLSRLDLTETQLQHMKQVDLTPEDLGGRYLSWRYLLRRLGSPAAGVWLDQAADSLDEYFGKADVQLASGEINTIDRTMGMHTDRVRSVLAGNGVSTFEGCSSDTYLGDPMALHANHLLRSALFSSLEASAMKGLNPRDKLARIFGIDGDRNEALRLAHRASLAVSRTGTDAVVYGKKPGEWVDMLFEVADEAPYVRLTDDLKTAIRGQFATWDETSSALNAWVKDNGVDRPSPEAYYELGLNNPAVYMRAQFNALREEHPTWTKEQLVRACELNAAKAFQKAGRFAVAGA